MAAHTLNTLSLCAGAGGLELGLSVADERMRTVCYVEREAYAAACLVARMEDAALDHAPVWDDVATFDAGRWRGIVDIVTSGDPCQPNSVAGKGLGADDDRWLLDHVLRIFDDSGADRFFRENVPGNAAGQIGFIVPRLEAMGCRVACGIFSAAEAGAGHWRERLFILADRARRRRGEGRAEPARRVGQPASDIGREPLAQPLDDGRQPGRLHAGQRRSGPGTPQPVGAGEAMGVAKGRPGRGEPQKQGTNRTGFAGTGSELADAVGAGSQGVAAAGRAEQDHGDAGRGGGAEIPLHAPGPDDLGWPHVLDLDPMLVPATDSLWLWSVARRNLGLPPVEHQPVRHRGNRRGGMARDLDKETTRAVKSEVRRISHVLANRVDRLRLTGNGCDPLQVAYAYRTLDALLAADSGAGVDAVRDDV